MDSATLFAALEKERAAREAAVRALEGRLLALETRFPVDGGVPLSYSHRSGGSDRSSGEDGGSSDSDSEEETLLFGPDPRLNGGRYAPPSGAEVTTLDLDLTGFYQLAGSVWDCCLFVGLDCMGMWRSLLLLVVTALAAGVQMYFCLCVTANMVDDPVSGDTLDALLYFRTSVMHDVRYADVAQRRSMAAEVCVGDDGYQMQWAGSQVSMLDNITKGLKSGKQLVLLALFVWFLTIIGEVDSIIKFLKAVAQVTKGRRTRLIEVGGGSIKVEAIGKQRFWAMVVFVAVPRMLIAASLGYTGALFLLATIDPKDLLLNTIALAFVLDVDELIYRILAPHRARCVLQHTECLPLPESQTARGGWLNNTLVKFVLVTALITISYTHGVRGIYARMQQAHEILCGGDVDFVFAINPATGLVEATKTAPGNGSSLSPVGLAVLELAHPTLRNQDEWTVDPTYLRVSKSAHMRAQLNIGLSDLRRHLGTFARNGSLNMRLNQVSPDAEVFTELLSLSSTSVSSVSAHAMCRDTSTSSHLKARLLDITGTQESCAHVQKFCAGSNATAVRSLCPVTCGCAQEFEPPAGFFASRLYGCPLACERALQATMRAKRVWRAKGGWNKPARACEDVPTAEFQTSAWLRDYFRSLIHETFSDVSSVTSLRHMLHSEGSVFGVPRNQSDDVLWSIINYTLVDLTASGQWVFARGVPHPRGLTGCAFWLSWEVTIMFGVDLCHFGHFRTLRMHCAKSCKCKNGKNECPLSCAR